MKFIIKLFVYLFLCCNIQSQTVSIGQLRFNEIRLKTIQIISPDLFVPVPVVPTITDPPNSPAYWFEFSENTYLNLSTLDITSVTNRMSASVLASGSGSTRPTWSSSLTSQGGPKGLARWSSGDYLDIDSSATFNSQNCSVFVITRGFPLDRGTFFHAPVSGTSWALYTWDAGELRVWDGGALSGNIGGGHGASVQWMIGGNANAWYGSDSLTVTNGSAFGSSSSSGGRIGIWSGGSFPYSDDIQSVVIYTNTLTLSQKNELLDWANTTYGTPSSICDTVLIFDGDSRTAGVINANPQVSPDWNDFSYPSQLQLLCSTNTPRIVNLGKGGALLRDYTNATDVIRHIQWNSRLGRRVVFGLWGHNDLNTSRTATQLKTDLDLWISKIRSIDSSVLIGHGTLFESTAFDPTEDSYRIDFNTYITNTVSGPDLDFFVDTENISGLTDPLDTEKFYDGVHPTASGYTDLAIGVRNSLLTNGYLSPVSLTSPPSENLFEHLDASIITGKDDHVVTTWTARKGPNAISSGNNRPILKKNQKNGLSVLRFDGIDDYMQSTFGITIPQPYVVFIVFRQRSVPVASTYIFDDIEVGTRGILASRGNGFFEVYGGTAYEYTHQIENTNWHIASIEFNGSSTKDKWDTSNDDTIVTGSPGSNGKTGLTIGIAVTLANGPAPIDVAEILVYTNSIADKSSHFAYLSDKWGAWTPDEIPGLKGWYKADAIAGKNDGETTTWSDSSGNGNDLTVGTPPTYETNEKNGKPVLRFDGTTQYIGKDITDINSPFSIFVVVKQYARKSGDCIIHWYNGGFQNYPVNTWNVWNSSDIPVGSNDLNWNIHGIKLNGASSNYRHNGGSWTSFTGSPGTLSMSTISIAGTYGGLILSQQDVGEVIVYSGFKSNHEGDKIFNYLNSTNRWNIY